MINRETLENFISTIQRILRVIQPEKFGFCHFMASGPIFLFQELWEIDKISRFFISKSKFFLVSKQAPLLIKYPTLKVREHLTSAPSLSPHKNFDSLLGRIA